VTCVLHFPGARLRKSSSAFRRDSIWTAFPPSTEPLAVSLPRDPLWSHFHHLVHYLDVVLSKRFRLVRLQVGIEAGSALRGRPERREHPGIARPGEECSNVRQERRGRDQCVNHEGSLVERSVGLLLHEQLNCLAQERKPPRLPAQGHVSTMRWASRMLTGPLNDRLPPARPAG
jgi:hypothetical protein